jgi:hypothetical protein
MHASFCDVCDSTVKHETETRFAGKMRVSYQSNGDPDGVTGRRLGEWKDERPTVQKTR